MRKGIYLGKEFNQIGIIKNGYIGDVNDIPRVLKKVYVVDTLGRARLSWEYVSGKRQLMIVDNGSNGGVYNWGIYLSADSEKSFKLVNSVSIDNGSITTAVRSFRVDDNTLLIVINDVNGKGKWKLYKVDMTSGIFTLIKSHSVKYLMSPFGSRLCGKYITMKSIEYTYSESKVYFYDYENDILYVSNYATARYYNIANNTDDLKPRILAIINTQTSANYYGLSEGSTTFIKQMSSVGVSPFFMFDRYIDLYNGVLKYQNDPNNDSFSYTSVNLVSVLGIASTSLVGIQNACQGNDIGIIVTTSLGSTYPCVVLATSDGKHG